MFFILTIKKIKSSYNLTNELFKNTMRKPNKRFTHLKIGRDYNNYCLLFIITPSLIIKTFLPSDTIDIASF